MKTIYVKPVMIKSVVCIQAAAAINKTSLQNT